MGFFSRLDLENRNQNLISTPEVPDEKLTSNTKNLILKQTTDSENILSTKSELISEVTEKVTFTDRNETEKSNSAGKNENSVSKELTAIKKNEFEKANVERAKEIKKETEEEKNFE